MYLDIPIFQHHLRRWIEMAAQSRVNDRNQYQNLKRLAVAVVLIVKRCLHEFVHVRVWLLHDAYIDKLSME